MTREEAIKTLQRDLAIQKENKALPDGIAAMEMAIQALQNEPLEVEAAKEQKAYNKGFEDCRHEALKCLEIIGDKKTLYEVQDAIEALPSVNPLSVFEEIKAEIREEAECAYADFEKYKVEYLGVDPEYVEDELPQDDYRYGMERCLEIISKHIRKEQE